MKNENKDLLGFEIIGLKEAKTSEEKIKAIEKHILLLEGLTSEAISALENKVANMKYPENHFL